MDPIADLLARIKNGYLAKKEYILIPFSNIKEKICVILVKNNYAESVKVEKENKNKQQIKLTLKYEKGTPVITSMERVSKLGLRVYKSKNKLPRVLGGLGIAIISTPKGIMTNKEAGKNNLGGEVICTIW